MNTQVRLYYRTFYTNKDEGHYSDGSRGYALDVLESTGFLVLFLPKQLDTLHKLLAQGPWVVDFEDPENTTLPDIETLLLDHENNEYIRELYPEWDRIGDDAEAKDFEAFIFNPEGDRDGADRGYYLEDGTEIENDDLETVFDEDDIEEGVLAFIPGGGMEEIEVATAGAPGFFKVFIGDTVEEYKTKKKFLQRIAELYP
jgi:hypothetical protein